MIIAQPRAALRHWWRRFDRSADGLLGDLTLYAVSTGFAGLTALTSTLTPHRSWGRIALVGYLVATLVVAGQLVIRHRALRAAVPGAVGVPGTTGRSGTADGSTAPGGPAGPVGGSRSAGTPARMVLTVLTWCATALLPLIWQAVERAGGRTDRAQEEVVVVENAGIRLVDTGTPYLARESIAALPADERLLGYTPYQPGMAVFGLPRAIVDNVWWTDARIWFALVTAVTLGIAALALRRTAADLDAPLLRAVQLSTVLPVCALTLATGGDDLPVLALCLLALALCAARRPGGAGLAIGLAAALKLFAWPIALVLLTHAVTRGRRWTWRLAVPAIGIPVATLVPVQLADRAALVENVLRFPLGHGLVASPAQSPFPGRLIAVALPAGRLVALTLLVAAGLMIAVRLVRRPPGTAAAVSAICGYGLLAAILLMPTTRFGYLLYPVALLAWVPALDAAVPVPVRGGRARPRSEVPAR